ncbi:MAG: methylated-DNA--[Oscillospiraceae bacterium]|nr:methylated-DNA--[protein]-cysteine S-methyltransferase [Oscillospiraceae bacterium]
MYSLQMTSPVGDLTLFANDRALTAIKFGKFPGGGENGILRLAEKELNEYFAGQRHEFTVPTELSGTAFQLKVWNSLLGIPYGETRTYGQVAAAIGCPGGARAIGGANSKNPIPIIVPCHRVVSSAGIGGYSPDLGIKRTLMAVENIEI